MVIKITDGINNFLVSDYFSDFGKILLTSPLYYLTFGPPIYFAIPICVRVMPGIRDKYRMNTVFFTVQESAENNYHCNVNKVSPYHRILFQHEALRSRLEIREYLLQTIVQEVYENIGQSLSLVRVYLVNLNASEENIQKASNIVGKSIKDLKALCELFYRDIESDNTTGWIKMLDYTIETLNQRACEPIHIAGDPIHISTGLKLILARMVQEILIAIHQQGVKLMRSQISFSPDAIKISIDISGGPFRLEDINCRGAMDISLKCLNFTEKAQLIKAGISRRMIEKGLHRIIIKVSLISPLNES